MEQNWESWNNPYTDGQLIFDKVSRSFSVEKTVFLTEGGGAAVVNWKIGIDNIYSVNTMH